jgi:hypothetical protein
MTNPREAAIAELDKQLEELGIEGEKEEKEEEIEAEEEQEEVEPAAPEEEKPIEEPKPIELKAPAVIPDSTLGYKLREEARKREALEKELAEIKKPKIPTKEEDYEAHIEAELGMTKAELAELKAWKEKQEAERQDNEMRNGAFEELQNYENEAAQAFPDYNDASTHVKKMIATSIKVLNPTISGKELAEQTINKYAQYAALALNESKHPGQAIYEMAAQMGYSKQEPVAAERPKITARPSLATIAENKKKSTGMHGGSGGKMGISNAEFVNMTNAERMKLSESDWARLEAESA